MRSLVLVAGLSLFSFSAAVASDDRPDHSEGLPSATLQEALSNLATYNRQLAELVALESLTPQQMHEVHMLTYTLENALERIDDEVDDMAEDLEAVHQASEHADPDTVKTKGAAYLEASGGFHQ